MMAVYPSRAVLDAWGKLGNPGWSFDSLAPYFGKFATVHSPGALAEKITGNAEYHDETLRGSGPVQVSFGEGYTEPLNGAWVKTFSRLGLKMTADPRTGQGLGAFQNPATIDPTSKTRSFAASAYLTPEVRQRSNLVVLTNSVVKKILFDETGPEVVAIGVSIQSPEGDRTISVASEVIVAAGALQSPQILELSGIGDRQRLESLGIHVAVDNPGVGEHLQDHALVCQSFEVDEGTPSGDVLRDPNVLQSLVELYSTTGGEGPMGQSNLSSAYVPLADRSGFLSAEAVAELLERYTPPADSSAPDPTAPLIREILQSPKEPAVQYLMFPFQTNITDNPSSILEAILPTRPENYVTIMTMLNHPFSKGSVHITSADIADKPVWEPNYLSHPLDLEVLARNVQFVEKIASTEFMRSALKTGGLRHPEIVADDLEKAREIVRQATVSVFHPSGSCSMLPRSQGGVVNERLVVHGARNVRVVDASIFPLEPLGNIQTTVYAVAERAADLIKEDRQRSAEA